jgi:hypothetical protein
LKVSQQTTQTHRERERERERESSRVVKKLLKLQRQVGSHGKRRKSKEEGTGVIEGLYREVLSEAIEEAR